jgi:hypothetical protein
MTPGDVFVVWRTSMNISSFNKLILIKIARYKLDLAVVQQISATISICNNMGLYFFIWKKENHQFGTGFLCTTQ